MIKDRKMIDKEQKQKILNELNQRLQGLTCPICQNQNFAMIDGYFYNYPQGNDFSSLNLGGQNIPTIAIVCNKCGFVSQHVLGVLGLLPKNKNDDCDGTR